jgi:predicted nucleic acid-binding protein
MTAFWDTSALVPLCCFQPQSAQARQVARAYSRQVVWWGTVIEAVSSLNRLTREGTLTAKESGQAFARLDYLRGHWNEIQPIEEVRHRAERLLRIHKLRAADALQLAAALVWCGNRPQGRALIGADGSLLQAAGAEGFTVIRLL